MLSALSSPIQPGPVVFDPVGAELSAVERDMLAHPMVGGVVLFGHNCHNPAQVSALIDACRSARPGPLVVMIDHEGGRVNRFSEGLTVLPPAAALGEFHALDPVRALDCARAVGHTMADELGALGVDLNLAPVVDLTGPGDVIGNRAIAIEPERVSVLAESLVSAMHEGGLGATAKHFPGHGGVTEDTHTSSAQDLRAFDAIEGRDLLPFKRLIACGVDAVMPTHVCFPKIDAMPAGYSTRWLSDILREALGFDGLIISDDISMAAAARAGGVVDAAQTAIAAGCDLVLSCQSPDAAEALLDGLKHDAGGVDRGLRLAQFQRNRARRRCDVDLNHALGLVAALTEFWSHRAN